MSLDEAAVERLLAEAEIRAVSNRFARGCDRLDLELVRSCFFADAIDDHGMYVGDVDGLIAFLEQVLTPEIATTHFLGQQEYEFVSPDVAYVESLVIARHRQPPRQGHGLRDAIAFGQYSDRFERRAGEWRIAHRVTLFLPSRIDAVVEDFPTPPDFATPPRGDASTAGRLVRPESFGRVGVAS
ncbi:nuclear transport factor 2 family protein [Pseudonocardia pini]|uniref:nuclear transport factor 2 family protein n=1 Tax=Pseudonocardia pini TaxID=2758030 RepID=UPI0015EFF025|nr:nuclear transport factor 2 family protein [Pseudonocardia pini]